jgi:S-adenosylmethionine:tRNA ribosyltransferase-isomerase
LFFQKATGAIIELFILEPISPSTEMTIAMGAKNSATWRCMVGNLKRWKNEILEISLKHLDKTFIFSAKEISRENGESIVEFNWDGNLTFSEILEVIGNLPLPPYLNREVTEEDTQNYQTIYAKSDGAVAAPTAGLHFTDDVFDTLRAKEIQFIETTLHVGAGTFKPVKSETMQDHEMHYEQMIFDIESISTLLESKSKGPIVAVGTTSSRLLESLFWLGKDIHQKNYKIAPADLIVTQWMPYENSDADISIYEAINAVLEYAKIHSLNQLIAKTGLLIAPGYNYKIVDGLITNFHQPNSTLLLLVGALVGENWKKIYEEALSENYRFLSFGDSSLLWKSRSL